MCYGLNGVTTVYWVDVFRCLCMTPVLCPFTTDKMLDTRQLTFFIILLWSNVFASPCARGGLMPYKGLLTQVFGSLTSIDTLLLLSAFFIV